MVSPVEPTPSPAGPDLAATEEIAGLTDHDVAVRMGRGQSNVQPKGASRSTADIVRANVFTRFNTLLGGLLVVALIIGPVQDTLFGILLVVNSGLGIIQELRAKRVLDRFRVLSAPRACVLREGGLREVALDQIVLDDVVEVGSGDQIPVDGTVLQSQGLEVDESLLTGESEPVGKAAGDEVLSGSFVVAGTARFRATRVGRDAYVGALASQAQVYTIVNSEISRGINQILRWVTWGIFPTAAILVFTQLRSDDNQSDALRGAVAGAVAMVPEGLVLLATMAFAVGVIRLGKQQVLVQQLPAIEVLARVDVFCMDKTGTLTEGHLGVVDVEPVEGGQREEAVQALGALAAADPRPNATLVAIGAEAPPPDGWRATAAVPFSSARRWSGADFGPHGTWLLGAAEALLTGDGHERVRSHVESLSRSGRRIVVLARSSQSLHAEQLPADRRPVALVVLEDEVRPDSARTVRYFTEQDVALKVLSGDNPATVGAVAERVGLGRADDAFDASELPGDPAGLREVLDDHQVFGRVAPHQKEGMVRALRDNNHVVAMIGDGVNDVPALKLADIGVALGSGTDASRVVAELVLLDSSFDGLPYVVREGRRVLANVQRVANLFLTKTVYAFFLAIAVGLAQLPFPFLPRHLTLVGSLTIGIPAFFLALAHRAPRAEPGFVPRVLRFAVPAGILAGAATFTAYAIARVTADVSLEEARTAATMVLMCFGLGLVGRLARPFTPGRAALIAAMALTYLGVVSFPATLDFFALNVPPPIVVLASLGSAGLALWVFELIDRQLQATPP
ncbi:MAG: cation-translocating P-type ATPase [Actinomycetota bacterium]|nr:cation-translocating P-type ATPase [Actinomycetota bacterium]